MKTIINRFRLALPVIHFDEIVPEIRVLILFHWGGLRDLPRQEPLRGSAGSLLLKHSRIAREASLVPITPCFCTFATVKTVINCFYLLTRLILCRVTA